MVTLVESSFTQLNMCGSMTLTLVKFASYFCIINIVT